MIRPVAATHKEAKEKAELSGRQSPLFLAGEP